MYRLSDKLSEGKSYSHSSFRAFLRPQVLMQQLAGFTWIMAVTCDDCHQTYILGIRQIITSFMTYFYFLPRLSLTFVTFIKLYQESKSHQRLCVYVLFFIEIILFQAYWRNSKAQFWINVPKEIVNIGCHLDTNCGFNKSKRAKPLILKCRNLILSLMNTSQYEQLKL